MSAKVNMPPREKRRSSPFGRVRQRRDIRIINGKYPGGSPFFRNYDVDDLIKWILTTKKAETYLRSPICNKDHPQIYARASKKNQAKLRRILEPGRSPRRRSPRHNSSASSSSSRSSDNGNLWEAASIAYGGRVL